MSDTDTLKPELSVAVKKIGENDKNILFHQREALVQRTSYDIEKEAFSYIREGETEKLINCIECLKEVNVGNMSKDSLQQCKYVACILMALSSRAAIAGGVNENVAFSLSDEVMLKIDSMTNIDAIYSYACKTAIKYSEMTKENGYGRNCSATVRLCMDYVSEHLHYKISLDELSQASGISKSYLSRLFKKETGYKISDYIIKSKIKEARDLLINSCFSCSEIANILGFSSQSYFTAKFKKYYNQTPVVYKNMNHK